MKMIREHKRASIAVAGCVTIWAGIAQMAGLGWTLIATGALAVLGCLLSMLPDDE